MKKAEINGTEITIQERSDWKTSIDQDFKPGDYFDEDIAWDLINAVPPHRWTGSYFQCGEPYSHKLNDQEIACPTYLTLVKVQDEPEAWKFCGYCFDGKEAE